VRDTVLEIGGTIILGLATVASAWSMYQSALWNGIQIFKIVESGAANRDIAETSVAAGQRRSMDAILFVNYSQAQFQQDPQLAQFFFNRFPPELKRATTAWLDTNPLDDPGAPPSPFAMPEYKLQKEDDLPALKQKETDAFDAAKAANHASDQYVRLTVLFTVSMFLSGIAGSLKKPKTKIGVLIFSTAILVLALVDLIGMPLAVE